MDADVRIYGAADYDESAHQVTRLGDVNGDGLDDVAVSAPGADAYTRDNGAVYVLFGPRSVGAVDLASPVFEGFSVVGPDRCSPELSCTPDDRFGDTYLGLALSAAGDVNGDGLADIIVTSGSDPHRVAGCCYEPGIYVIFGSASTATVDLDDLGARGFRIVRESLHNEAAVAAIGDVNGDGLGDVVVGMLDDDNNGRENAGSAYVIFGKTSADMVDLDALGEGGFRIDGAAAGDQTGYSVSGPGDVNGDGVPDILIGAVEAANDRGSAYVVFGRGSTVDVDLAALGDGGFKMVGAVGDLAGFSVSGAGDVNGDGLRDVAVGASFAAATGGAGHAYIVFGQASSADVDLAALQTRGFSIEPSADDGWLGFSISAAGDMNGDGLADVVLGAPYASHNGRSTSGSAYVIFGKASTGAVDLGCLATGGFRMDGARGPDALHTVGSIAGISVAGGFDWNGDGLGDVLVGAQFADSNGRILAGESYVVYGATASPTLSSGSSGRTTSTSTPLLVSRSPLHSSFNRDRTQFAGATLGAACNVNFAETSTSQ